MKKRRDFFITNGSGHNLYFDRNQINRMTTLTKVNTDKVIEFLQMYYELLHQTKYKYVGTYYVDGKGNVNVR